MILSLKNLNGDVAHQEILDVEIKRLLTRYIPIVQGDPFIEHLLVVGFFSNIDDYMETTVSKDAILFSQWRKNVCYEQELPLGPLAHLNPWATLGIGQ